MIHNCVRWSLKMSVLMWVKFVHTYSYCLQRWWSLPLGVQIKKYENDWLHVGRKVTEFHFLSIYAYKWVRTTHITIYYYITLCCSILYYYVVFYCSCCKILILLTTLRYIYKTMLCLTYPESHVWLLGLKINK